MDKACFVRPGVFKQSVDFSKYVTTTTDKHDFDEDVIITKKPTKSMTQRAEDEARMIFCFVRIPEGLHRDAWLEGFLYGRNLERSAHLCIFDCLHLSIKEGVKLIRERYNKCSLFKMNLGVLTTKGCVNVIVPDNLLAGTKTEDAKTTHKW